MQSLQKVFLPYEDLQMWKDLLILPLDVNEPTEETGSITFQLSEHVIKFLL